MADKAKEDVKLKSTDVQVNDDPDNTVVYHFDKDLNDPRNAVKAVPGPSLNDMSWQTKSEDK